MKLTTRQVLMAVALLTASSAARAVNPFTLVIDGYPFATKQLEYENTFSLAHAAPGDSKYLLASNESELEYGVSENLTLTASVGLYYEHTPDVPAGTHFDSAGLQAQYFFTNPNTDAVGVSVVSALSAGETVLTSDNFLVVQKDFDKWIVGYNLGLTVDVDGFSQGGPADTTLTLTNAGGALYCLTNSVRVGGELSLQTGFTEFFRHKQDTTLYAGPVVNWIVTDKLWITVGVNFEMLRESADAPYYQCAVSLGYTF